MNSGGAMSAPLPEDRPMTKRRGPHLTLALGIALIPLLTGCSAERRMGDAAGRTSAMNRLKQIGLALHNFQDTYKSLPIGGPGPAVPEFQPRDPKRTHWRAAILPF